MSLDGEEPSPTQDLWGCGVWATQIWRYSIFDLEWNCTPFKCGAQFGDIPGFTVPAQKEVVAIARKAFTEFHLMC